MYNVLYGLLWGFLRRWFGGLFPEEKYKILGNRGLQTTIMIICLFPIIFFKCKDLYQALPLYLCTTIASIITLWIQFQYWSRGHGATFLDMGRDKNPNLSRYARWFKVPLDYIWNKLLYLKNNNKFFKWLLQRWSGEMYGYSYDMWYHTLRYTLCMVLVSIALADINYIFIGLLNAPIYEMCIRLYENKSYKWMKYDWLNSSNKLAEILNGFIFGFLTF